MKDLAPKIATLVLALIFTLFYPYLGCLLADKFEYGFTIKWLYIHHSVQMLLALATIAIITLLVRKSKGLWGLNIHKWHWSLKIALIFAAVWFLISLIINMFLSIPQELPYKLTASNIAADLCFDFTLTGLSEEILFRGLVMGLLLLAWEGKLSIGSFTVSTAGVLATLFFALAHIGIDYQSLTLTYFNPLQLVFVVGLGLFYALMRDKTGSLLGPVIAHGASDGLITVIQLVLR